MLELNGMRLTKIASKKLVQKTILESVAIGDILLKGTPYFNIINDLLSYHPDKLEKIGCGIKCFHIVADPVYRNKRFEIERVDGSRIDFSYLVCIKGRSSTKEENALLAFRNAIFPQIKDFKQRSFYNKNVVECALTSVLLTFDEASVDHTPPLHFRKLVDDFLKEENLLLEEIETIENDFKNTRLLADNNIFIKWYAFHEERAELQIACLDANIRQGTGEKNAIG